MHVFTVHLWVWFPVHMHALHTSMSLTGKNMAYKNGSIFAAYDMNGENNKCFDNIYFLPYYISAFFTLCILT